MSLKVVVRVAPPWRGDGATRCLLPSAAGISSNAATSVAGVGSVCTDRKTIELCGSEAPRAAFQAHEVGGCSSSGSLGADREPSGGEKLVFDRVYPGTTLASSVYSDSLSSLVHLAHCGQRSSAVVLAVGRSGAQGPSESTQRSRPDLTGSPLSPCVESELGLAVALVWLALKSSLAEPHIPEGIGEVQASRKSVLMSWCGFRDGKLWDVFSDLSRRRDVTSRGTKPRIQEDWPEGGGRELTVAGLTEIELFSTDGLLKTLKAARNRLGEHEHSLFTISVERGPPHPRGWLQVFSLVGNSCGESASKRLRVQPKTSLDVLNLLQMAGTTLPVQLFPAQRMIASCLTAPHKTLLMLSLRSCSGCERDAVACLRACMCLRERARRCQVASDMLDGGGGGNNGCQDVPSSSGCFGTVQRSIASAAELVAGHSPPASSELSQTLLVESPSQLSCSVAATSAMWSSESESQCSTSHCLPSQRPPKSRSEFMPLDVHPTALGTETQAVAAIRGQSAPVIAARGAAPERLPATRPRRARSSSRCGRPMGASGVSRSGASGGDIAGLTAYDRRGYGRGYSTQRVVRGHVASEHTETLVADDQWDIALLRARLEQMEVEQERVRVEAAETRAQLLRGEEHEHALQQLCDEHTEALSVQYSALDGSRKQVRALEARCAALGDALEARRLDVDEDTKVALGAKDRAVIELQARVNKAGEREEKLRLELEFASSELSATGRRLSALETADARRKQNDEATSRHQESSTAVWRRRRSSSRGCSGGSRSRLFREELGARNHAVRCLEAYVHEQQQREADLASELTAATCEHDVAEKKLVAWEASEERRTQMAARAAATAAVAAATVGASADAGVISGPFRAPRLTQDAPCSDFVRPSSRATATGQQLNLAAVVGLHGQPPPGIPEHSTTPGRAVSIFGVPRRVCEDTTPEKHSEEYHRIPGISGDSDGERQDRWDHMIGNVWGSWSRDETPPARISPRNHSCERHYNATNSPPASTCDTSLAPSFSSSPWSGGRTTFSISPQPRLVDALTPEATVRQNVGVTAGSAAKITTTVHQPTSPASPWEIAELRAFLEARFGTLERAVDHLAPRGGESKILSLESLAGALKTLGYLEDGGGNDAAVYRLWASLVNMAGGRTLDDGSVSWIVLQQLLLAQDSSFCRSSIVNPQIGDIALV